MSYYEGFGVTNPAIATENVFDGGIVAYDAPANLPQDDSLFADGASADALDIFDDGFQEAVGGFGSNDYSQAMAGVRPMIYSGVGAVRPQMYSGMGALHPRVYSGFGLDAEKFDPAQIWAWFETSQQKDAKGNYTAAANAAGKKWAFFVKAALAQLGFGITPTQEQLDSETVVSFGNDGIKALKEWRAAGGYSSPYPFLDPRTKGKQNDELVVMRRQIEANKPIGKEKPQSYDISFDPNAIVTATPTEQQPAAPPPQRWTPPPGPRRAVDQQPAAQVFVPPAQSPGMQASLWAPSANQVVREIREPAAAKPKLSTANMILIGGAALAVGIAAFAFFAKKAPAPAEASSTAMTPNKRGKKKAHKKAKHLARKARHSVSPLFRANKKRH
jgi:hypothetical protein